MKISTTTKNLHGFTLLELIVVIAILATLAGISYPAIMGVQENARIASSSKTCVDIVAGVTNFKQDHNGIMPYYPNDAKPDRKDQIYLATQAGKDAGMVSILTGYEEGDVKLNLNNEAYMKPNKAEEPRDGIYGESADELSLFDPWGKPYYVVLSESLDGCIDPFTEKRIRREHCLVYGLGPDGEGVARVHSDASKKRAASKSNSGRTQTSAEKRQAARDAAEAAEDALLDNVYSWKKTVKK